MKQLKQKFPNLPVHLSGFTRFTSGTSFTRFSLMIALMSGVISCGKKSSSSNGENIIQQLPNTGASADLLPYQACIDSRKKEHDPITGPFKVPYRINGKEKLTEVKLATVTNTPGLADSSNKESLPLKFLATNGVYSKEILVLVDENKKITGIKLIKNSNELFLNSYSITKKPTLMTLCDRKQYPIHSAENIALSAIPVLEKSFQVAQKNLSEDNAIFTPTPLKVIINSNFSTQITVEQRNSQNNKLLKKLISKKDDTLNAFWASNPDKKNDDYIVIYPHPRPNTPYPNINAQLKKFPRVWELPFTLAHEYGHHIFMNTLINSISDQQNKTIAAHHNSNEYFDLKTQVAFNRIFEWSHPEFNGIELAKMMKHYSASETDDLSIVEKVKLNLVDAFSEGLADLYAYFVVGASYSNFDYEPCLLKSTRTIFNRNFSDYSLKEFSPQNIDKFAVPEDESNDDPSNDDNNPNNINICSDTPNIADPHHFGAIIAYGIYQLLSKSILNEKEKIKFLYALSGNIYSLIENNENKAGQPSRSTDSNWDYDLSNNKEETDIAKLITKYTLLDIFSFYVSKTGLALTSNQCEDINLLFPDQDSDTTKHISDLGCNFN